MTTPSLLSLKKQQPSQHDGGGQGQIVSHSGERAPDKYWAGLDVHSLPGGAAALLLPAKRKECEVTRRSSAGRTTAFLRKTEVATESWRSMGSGKPSASSFQVVLHQSESTCAKASFFLFSCKMPAESTTLLSCSTRNATLTSTRIRTPILCRQVARLMFQGNVESVAKEPTVSAPSTMYFPVAAPPECRDGQIVLSGLQGSWTFPFPFHKL